MPKMFLTTDDYLVLVDASPMPMAIFSGPEMVVSAVNQQMLNIMRTDYSILNKPLKLAVPDLGDESFYDLLNQVFITGEEYSGYDAPTKLLVEGMIETFYFNFKYKPLKNNSGESFAIICTANDVTELVNNRKKIKEKQERLSFALTSAGIGTWDLDTINKIVYWDSICKDLFGFNLTSSVPYEDVLKFIHPEDRPEVNQAVLNAIDPKSKGIYDIRYRTINNESGLVRWLHCKGNAYFNDEGIAYRFAGTAIDVTEEVKSRRREQRLLSLVSNNADHMTVADMDGNLLYMNDAAKKLLGVNSNTDVTTLTVRSFYTPDEFERVQNGIIKEIKSDEGWHGNIYLMNIQTKEIIPCLVNYILIKDPETGDIIGRGATAHDLRQEIKAKADLQRLATIVDSSEDFSNYCDINGKTLYINPSGVKLIGIDPAKVEQYTLYDYHSEKTNVLIKNELMSVLLTEGKWSGALELLNQKTGEIIPIHKQLYMIREEITNKPVAIAGIARDLRPELNARKVITEKNEALQKAIMEMEFLANTVPTVVWTSTPDGNLDYLNKRWTEQSGIPVEESLGDRWVNSIHIEDRKATQIAWKHALETGEPYEVEFRSVDRNGKYRWQLVRALALKDNNGKILKWYGTNTDVQIQKELEHQKDNFLGIASHELKTPVTSLKAYAQVMERMFLKSGDAKNAELLSKMNKQVDRLTSLISDLLDVTKINAGRLQFNQTSFNFNEMVEEVIEDVQRTSTKHIIKSELNFRGKITGDRERICQVITNFLTNAVKYSPNADEVFIYTKDLEDQVQVCVQDFGIGIEKTKIDQVFEQFYRVSGNKEHTFPGLGLGLYISSEIVKRLGGKIWVTSELGVGSTFCFSIPLDQP